VTAPDPDYARGWLFAERLLDEDRLARVDAMSDEEVEAELRAGGVDPERVPSAEDLLAKAAAFAAGEVSGAVDHARGWAFAQKLLAEDGEEKPATPDGARSVDYYLARAAELARQEEARGKASPLPSSLPKRSPRRRRMTWVAALVPAALVTIFAVMNGGAIAAIVRGQEVKPTDTWFPWRPPPPTPQQKAASIRVEALAACNSQDWSDCETKLDEAAEIDPEGENAKVVVKARTAIDAWRRATDPGRKPHLKPTPGP
jgi:hypothetical protein